MAKTVILAIRAINCASLADMSRDSAAVVDDPISDRVEPALDLHSLNQGIEILGRFEQILAELELALDAIPLSSY